MGGTGRRGVIAVVVLVGVLTLTPAATLGGVADGHGTPTAGLQADVQENNSTTTQPQQENPADVGEDGDQQALQQWLENELAGRLGESAIQISQGQYEYADELLGDEYQDALSKYVDVTGDTEGEEESERRRELFNETAEQQSEYAQLIAEFRDTYEAYQEARRNGNESRARELARELRSLAEQLDALSMSLTSNYGNISEITGISFDEEIAAITNTTRNVTNQTQTVVIEVFTPTSVAVRASPNGSVTNPVQIAGQIEANDTAPFNGSVVVHINDRVFRSDVASDGSFMLSYRPVTAPVGRTNATVAYRPAADSIYLGAETAVQTNITQSEPVVAVTSSPQELKYGDRAAVNGRVTVRGQSVPDAPVTLTIGGTQIAQTQTNGDGEYAFDAALPAVIQAGTRTLAVHVGEAETALAPATNQSAVTVTQTATSLSLSTTQRGDEIAIDARLQTEAGAGIAGQTIQITRNGTVVQTVQTNATGSIETTIPTEDTDGDGTTVRLGAVFDGDGTNLESARATSTLTLSFERAGGGDESSDWLPVSPPVLAVGVVVVLLGSGYTFVRYRQDTAPAGENATDSERGQDSEISETTAGPDAEFQIEDVTELAAQGNTASAVRTLYGAVRSQHATEDANALTHWEFYTAVSDELTAESRDALRDITEAYETVQFAEANVDADVVEELASEAQKHLVAEGRNRNPHPNAHQSDT